MTTEELLKPRYKVIADYPKSLYHVGDILNAGWRSEDLIYCDHDGPRWRDYPHLFKKLEWWEDRKIEDMPEYLKQTGMVDGADNPIPDWYLKVKKHFNAGNGEWRDDSINIFCIDKCDRTIGTNMSYSGFEPTTREEYEQHQLSKTK